MSIRAVKVSNVSLSATEQEIKELFSFSGDVEHVEIQSGNDWSKTAYITFKDSQDAETAVLLSGATIVDQSVTVSLASDYKLSPTASALATGATIVDQSDTVSLASDYKLSPTASALATATENKNAGGDGSAVQKAEDVVSSMLAKGFILGKDALNHAKAFDERHRFTSTASAKASSLDQKIGFSEKISMGANVVNDKVKEINQKFQVSEKTKTAFTAAEQTMSNAGSAFMRNRYVLNGATWVTCAFKRVTKVAGEVGQKTKEKVSEEELGRNAAQGYVQIHKSDSPVAGKSELSSHNL